MPRTDPSNRSCVTLYEVTEVNAAANPDLAEQLAESRAQPSSQTGIMMKFSPVEYANLSAFDILDTDGSSYPVPPSALDSLPPQVRAELWETGSVQIIAMYDSEAGEFESAHLPGDEKPFAKRVAELMELPDVSLVQAVDYVTVEERGTYSRSNWKAIREVSRGGINASIRAVENAVEDESLNVDSSSGDRVQVDQSESMDSPIPAESSDQD